MNASPINTALCSFGMSGYVFHAPFISVNPKFNFYGVLERTRKNAEKKYPNVKTFRTLDDLLLDKNIDLVVVNTPSITHFDFAKKIIIAGKNVIVEKPFTATSQQAQELIQLAVQKKVTLSVYHNRRYDSDFKTVKKILDKGYLGKIIDAEIHYDRYEPVLSYKIHKETPTEAVGSLYDLGSHLIDQAMVLFGFPVSVYADLNSFRPNSKVVDYFDLKLFYPAHKVTLKSSYFVRELLPGNIFHGTKGSFIKSKADIQERELQAGKIPGTQDWGIEPAQEQGILHTEKEGQISREYIPTLQGNYMDYYDAIFDAIRFKKAVPVSGIEAMNVIKIVEAALKSHNEKKVIDL